MRTLLLALLILMTSSAFANDGQLRETSYAPPVDCCGWQHRFDAYYGDGFGNYCDVDCCQLHRNGYFFFRHCGNYFPDYQHPRIASFYGHHYRPLVSRPACPQPRGFYRCYNREGLSIECYKQHWGKG